jgi:anti-anti-sigma factor
MPFAVRAEKEGDLLILALSGELDSKTAPELDREIGKALGKSGRALLFDLTDLDFVASAGLRIFIMVGKRLSSDGGAIALCGLNPSVREVFEISGFVKLFPILPDRRAALAKLSGNARLANIGRLADRLLHKGAEPGAASWLAGCPPADATKVALAAEILRRSLSKPT